MWRGFRERDLDHIRYNQNSPAFRVPYVQGDAAPARPRLALGSLAPPPKLHLVNPPSPLDRQFTIVEEWANTKDDARYTPLLENRSPAAEVAAKRVKPELESRSGQLFSTFFRASRLSISINTFIITFWPVRFSQTSLHFFTHTLAGVQQAAEQAWWPSGNRMISAKPEPCLLRLGHHHELTTTFCPEIS